jgi:hypothetical protein
LILAAAARVLNGPAIPLSAVRNGAGRLPLFATVNDRNGNPVYRDESLSPGLDAARAVVVRTWEGFPGIYFTRDRTLAQLGTNFQNGYLWATTIKVLDAVVPVLIGNIQSAVAVDPDTGTIDETVAGELEQLMNAQAKIQAVDRGYVTEASTQIDRTVNLFTSPEIPVTLSIIPLAIIDSFKLTVALKNPQFQAA